MDLSDTSKTANDIYLRLNPEGKGCLRLYDADSLIAGFSPVQQSALTRFFDYFINTTKLYMMSRNFFITNLSKAFEERTFDLDSLFLDGKKVVSKNKFDKLLSTKRNQLSSVDKSEDAKKLNDYKTDVNSTAKHRKELRDISSNLENKLNQKTDKIKQNIDLIRKKSADSSNCLSNTSNYDTSQQVSIDTPKFKYNFVVQNDNSHTITSGNPICNYNHNQTQNNLNDNRDDRDDREHREHRETKDERNEFQQFLSKQIKNQYGSNLSEEYNVCKGQDKDVFVDQFEHVKHEPLSLKQFNSNNSNLSVYNPDTDMFKSDIEAHIKQIYESLHHDDSTAVTLSEPTRRSSQYQHVKAKVYDTLSPTNNSSKGAHLNQSQSQSLLQLNRQSSLSAISNENSMYREFKKDNNIKVSSSKHNANAKMQISQPKPKHSDELALEKCTFTPQLFTKRNNSKPRLYDWVKTNKHTINSNNDYLTNRIKTSMTFKNTLNSSMNKSVELQKDLHSRDKQRESPSKSSKTRKNALNENEFITAELSSLKQEKQAKKQQQLNKSGSKSTFQTEGENIGYTDLYRYKQEYSLKHHQNDLVAKRLDDLTLQSDQNRVLRLQNSNIPLCAMNFKTMYNNQEVIDARKKLFELYQPNK